MISKIIFYSIIIFSVYYTLYKIKKIIFNQETPCTNCPSRKRCSSANSENASSCSNESLALSQEDKDKIKDIIENFNI